MFHGLWKSLCADGRLSVFSDRQIAIPMLIRDRNFGLAPIAFDGMIGLLAWKRRCETVMIFLVIFIGQVSRWLRRDLTCYHGRWVTIRRL